LSFSKIVVNLKSWSETISPHCKNDAHKITFGLV